MNILVIGGAGYIGSVTAHIAAKNGHGITIFDNLSSGQQKNVPKGASFIEGDVRSANDLQEAFERKKYDVVLHFAAKILVPESMDQPYEYLQTNSFGVLNAVNAAVANGVKHYVLSSTAAVYGMPDSFPISEDSPKNPINPYGESKLIAEHILSSYQEAKDLNWLAFRYFNVAGAYENIGPDYPFISHIIPALLHRTYRNMSFSINGRDYNTEDGTCVRDFVHVYDIGRAHVIAAEKMFSGEIFRTAINLGSSTGSSVKEIVDTFREVTMKQIKITYGERRAGDPDMLVASNQKARELIGWQPEKNIRDIITDQSNWYDLLPSTSRVKQL